MKSIRWLQISSVKILAGQNFSSGKIFRRLKLRHFLKISSLLTDEIKTDKVYRCLFVTKGSYRPHAATHRYFVWIRLVWLRNLWEILRAHKASAKRWGSFLLKRNVRSPSNEHRKWVMWENCQCVRPPTSSVEKKCVYRFTKEYEMC